ncbi:MAG: hypothetical protein ABFD20_00825 [Anaerolineales bacterium]
MTVWLVRAGAQGENEQFALDHSIAVVGWDEVPSLQGCSSRDEVLAVLQQVNPNDSLNRLKNHAAQLWAFVGRIAVGDLVVLPLKTRTAIAIGRVTGQYLYSANNPDGAHHVRPASWLRTDIPRHALGQDLLYSLGAFMRCVRYRVTTPNSASEPSCLQAPTQGTSVQAQTMLTRPTGLPSSLQTSRSMRATRLRATLAATSVAMSWPAW